MDVPLQEIATAEGKKAALEMSARAVREEHEDLQRELETVQLSVEAAKADVTTAQRELRTLRDKVCTPAGCMNTFQTIKADFVASSEVGYKYTCTGCASRAQVTDSLWHSSLQNDVIWTAEQENTAVTFYVKIWVCQPTGWASHDTKQEKT